MKPVDPEDPTKGYVPPTLPTDPSQDTPINYTKITTSYVTVDPMVKKSLFQIIQQLKVTNLRKISQDINL